MIKTLKTFLENVIKILYILLCIVTTCILLLFLFFVITANAFGFKLILYVIFILVCLAGFWSLLFVKIKPIMKFLVFLFLSVITSLLFLFPSPMGFIYIDTCVDTGICVEGMTMKNNQGQIVPINEENCISNGYVWYEKDKSCNLRKN